MKVTFSKKKLMAALTPAAGISQTKNTYASCDGLLFECPPDKRFGDYDLGNPDLCRISVFDFEKGLRTTIECTVHEKGMCVIHTQSILQIVRALPDGEITMDIDANGGAVLSGGKVNVRISAGPGETFPTMPMFIGTKSFRIAQYRLRRVLSETVFAVAQNDLLRMGFNGGLLRIKGNELIVVGCDNHKLAASCCTVSPSDVESEDTEILIPGKFLSELHRLLSDTEDEIIMILGRKHAIFHLGPIYFFTRILETGYPDYEKMLPSAYTTEAFLSRTELLEAVERASIIADAKVGGGAGTYIKLEFMNNTVVVSSVSSGGAIDETLRAAVNGPDLAIGFESRNLLDTLKACPADCEWLRLRLNSPLMGMQIDPYDEYEEEKRFMYFVLPTRMNIPLK